MKLYQVVWDEKYNSNCHDEILTDPIPEEGAIQYATLWAEHKVLSAFPTISKEDELFGKMVAAKKEELSYIPVEDEPEPTTMPMKEGWVDILEEAIRQRRRQAEDTLANGFGNRDYILGEIKGYSALLRCIAYAKQKGCNRATLVFEKVD